MMKNLRKRISVLLSAALVSVSMMTSYASAVSTNGTYAVKQTFDFEASSTNTRTDDASVEWSPENIDTGRWNLAIGDVGYMYHNNEVSGMVMQDEGTSNHYLRIKGYGIGGNAAFRTGIKLIPDTYYRVTYKYQLSDTAIFSKKVGFTLSRDEDAWDHAMLPGTEVPCYISGCRMNAAGTAYESYENADDVTHTLISTTEWKTVTDIIYTGSAANASQKYLGMFFQLSDTAGNFMIDDLTAEQFDPTYGNADKVTFDFSKADGSYISKEKVSAKWMHLPYVKNNESLYLDNTNNWGYTTFHFNYLLQSNTNYRVTWKRNILSNNGSGSMCSGFYAAPNKLCWESDLKNENRLHTIPDGYTTFDSKLGWTVDMEETFTFTTGEINESNNWLGFLSHPVEGGMEIYIKYLTIEKIQDGETYTPEYVDFEENGTTYSKLFNSSGDKASVGYVNDVYGNRYLNIGAGKSVGEDNSYPLAAMRTNIELLPNTDYTLSFNFKGTNNSPSFYAAAGRGDDNWDFFTPSYIGDSDEIYRRACLNGNDQTGTVGTTQFTYRDGNFQAAGGNIWQTITVSFNSGSIVTDTNKYLTLIFKFWPDDNADRTISYDDIILVKNGERGTANTVICNQGHGRSMISRNADALGSIPSFNGYIFNGWYTDIERQTAYVYDAASAVPEMLYAGYSLDVNDDSLSDVRDLVRLKKISSGVITEYMAAADCDSNGIVGAPELTHLRKSLLK